MTDFIQLGETQTGVDRVITSPTLQALYSNVRAALRGLGANRPRLHTRAFEDLAKGNVARFHDTRFFDTLSDTFFVVNRYSFAQSGSVRIEVSHQSLNSGESELQIYYDGVQLGSWTRSGSATPRTVDIDNLEPGKVLLLQHRQSGSFNLGSAASRMQDIRFLTTGMNIMPAVYGYLYGDIAE